MQEKPPITIASPHERGERHDGPFRDHHSAHRGHDGVGLCLRRGQRLVEVEVFTRLSTTDSDTAPPLWGRADTDDMNVRTGQGIAQVGDVR